jgi:hypothetical protein
MKWLALEKYDKLKIVIYGPMIYVYVMFLMRANPLRGQVGWGWALEMDTFLGPVIWPRAVGRVPFGTQVMDFPSSKALCTGPYQSEVYR